MEQQVFKYTVDLRYYFDWWIWKLHMTVDSQINAIRLAERYGIERTRRSNVVEIEAVVLVPGQTIVKQGQAYRLATIGELLAFAEAFPNAPWEYTLVAQGTDVYYGHADGCPSLSRTGSDRTLSICWAFRYELRSRLFVRNV